MKNTLNKLIFVLIFSISILPVIGNDIKVTQILQGTWD